MSTPIWEKMNYESEIEFDLFTEYLDFGSARSIKGIADVHCMDQKDVLALSEKNKWKARALAFDRTEEEKCLNGKLVLRRVRNDGDMQLRLEILGLEMIAKASEALEKKKIQSYSGTDIVKMMMAGFMLVEKSREQKKSNPDEAISLDEIDKALNNILRSAKGHKAIPPPSDKIVDVEFSEDRSKEWEDF